MITRISNFFYQRDISKILMAEVRRDQGDLSLPLNTKLLKFLENTFLKLIFFKNFLREGPRTAHFPKRVIPNPQNPSNEITNMGEGSNPSPLMI